jgi:hypothetical protein
MSLRVRVRLYSKTRKKTQKRHCGNEFYRCVSNHWWMLPSRWHFNTLLMMCILWIEARSTWTQALEYPVTLVPAPKIMLFVMDDLQWVRLARESKMYFSRDVYVATWWKVRQGARKKWMYRKGFQPSTNHQPSGSVWHQTDTYVKMPYKRLGGWAELKSFLSRASWYPLLRSAGTP